MEVDSTNNAMTEIALALAMGFFSLMILTMISMQVKSIVTEPNAQSEQPRWKISAMAVDPATEDATSSAVVEPELEDRFMIYADGKYYDQELVRIDPEEISAHPGRVILGVSPSLPMSETLSVRSRIEHQALVVTTLNQEWLQALQVRGIKE